MLVRIATESTRVIKDTPPWRSVPARMIVLLLAQAGPRAWAGVPAGPDPALALVVNALHLEVLNQRARGPYYPKSHIAVPAVRAEPYEGAAVQTIVFAKK